MKSLIVVGMAMALATAVWAQAPSESAKANPDQKFVMDTARSGMAEVDLGKMAVQKASKDEVKRFGQLMVDDHSKAVDELKGLALRKSISWPAEPDAEQKALRDRLSKLTGDEFNRAYMDAMVNAHRKGVAAFQTEAQSGADPEIKAWAAKTLPTVEAHLKHAQHVSGTVGAPTSTQ
jgi:putative membrane protein